jgi:hypothetical protein
MVVIKFETLNKNGKKRKKKENQFTKSSELTPLASNPGTGSFDWGFLKLFQS